MVVDRLLIVIVQHADASSVAKALRRSQIAFTQMTTRGAFLNFGNTTFMIGTQADNIPSILAVIQKHCHEREILMKNGHITLHPDVYAYPITVSVGGAIVFSLPVERYIHFT